MITLFEAKRKQTVRCIAAVPNRFVGPKQPFGRVRTSDVGGAAGHATSHVEVEVEIDTDDRWPRGHIPNT
jgi:hypothetical protein